MMLLLPRMKSIALVAAAAAASRGPATCMATAAAAHWQAAAGTAAAEFRLARVITSSMVLQAERPAVFGWAAKGATVAVTTSDGETAPPVVANASSGAWRVVMQPRAAKVI